MKKHIPNFFTLLNLLFGCLAIVCTFEGAYEWVWVFAFAGGIADVWDGLLARLLNAHTELGKQLDSLADMVSSGVLSSVILFDLMHQALARTFTGADALSLPATLLLSLPVFAVAMAAAWRLGNFNLDTEQSHHFIGMPTPAGMILVVGLLMVSHYDAAGLRSWILHPFALYFVAFGVAFLFVSRIPMMSIKFKNLRWRGNELRIFYLLICLVLVLTLRWIAVPLGIFLYVVLSLLQPFIAPKTKGE